MALIVIDKVYANLSGKLRKTSHTLTNQKAGIMECDECGRKVLDLKRHKEILHK